MLMSPTKALTRKTLPLDTAEIYMPAMQQEERGVVV